MIINANKMKKMLLGPLSKSSSSKLFIGQAKAESVTGFKLLDINITVIWSGTRILRKSMQKPPRDCIS